MKLKNLHILELVLNRMKSTSCEIHKLLRRYGELFFFSFRMLWGYFPKRFDITLYQMVRKWRKSHNNVHTE